ncbi:MAG: hypothetical protein U9O66_03365, partial [Patescibacteria group bacterium]|nr:hypothetical protein [Patescibacteria group bacterium]
MEIPKNTNQTAEDVEKGFDFVLDDVKKFGRKRDIELMDKQGFIEFNRLEAAEAFQERYPSGIKMEQTTDGKYRFTPIDKDWHKQCEEKKQPATKTAEERQEQIEKEWRDEQEIEKNPIDAKAEIIDAQKEDVKKTEGEKLEDKKTENDSQDAKEKIIDVTKKEAEEKKEIDQEVVDYFKNDLTIDKKDLEAVKGFSNLSEGQQLLVLENVKQISLGRVEKGAKAEQRKELKNFVSKKAKFWQIKNDLIDTVEHLKTLSQNIWTNSIKNFAGAKIAKLEKLKFEELDKGGTKTYGVVLEQLVNGMIDENTGKARDDIPNVEKIEKKNGEYELDIKYLAVPENADKKKKKLYENFNQSASEFSKIPDQWLDKSAKFSEKRKYKNARKKYEKARSNIINIKTESGEKNALLEMNEIDYKLQMSQCLNSHPDVEEQIQNIRNEASWKRAFRKASKERFGQFSAGYMSRTATIALGGAAGLSIAITVPAAVLGLGAHRAMKRGKKSLDEGYELSRNILKEKDKENITEEGRTERYFLEKYAAIKEKIRKIKQIGEEEKRELSEEEKVFKKYYEDELKVLDKQEAQKLLTKKDFIDVEYLNESFDDLMDEVKSQNFFIKETNLQGGKLQKAQDNKKYEIMKSLVFHIKETREKLKDKTINFGSDNEFLPNQYKLVRKLSEAEAIVNTSELFKNLDKDELLKEDLEGGIKKIDEKEESNAGIKELIYNIQNAKISKTKRKYLLGKAGMGVATSAAFFYAGSYVRDSLTPNFVKETASNIKRDISKSRLNSDIIDEIEKDGVITDQEMQDAQNLQKALDDIFGDNSDWSFITKAYADNVYDNLFLDEQKKCKDIIRALSAEEKLSIIKGSNNADQATDKLLKYAYLELAKQSGKRVETVADGLLNTDETGKIKRLETDLKNIDKEKLDALNELEQARKENGFNSEEVDKKVKKVDEIVNEKRETKEQIKKTTDAI